MLFVTYWYTCLIYMYRIHFANAGCVFSCCIKFNDSFDQNMLQNSIDGRQCTFVGPFVSVKPFTLKVGRAHTCSKRYSRQIRHTGPNFGPLCWCACVTTSSSYQGRLEQVYAMLGTEVFHPNVPSRIPSSNSPSDNHLSSSLNRL